MENKKFNITLDYKNIKQLYKLVNKCNDLYLHESCFLKLECFEGKLHAKVVGNTNGSDYTFNNTLCINTVSEYDKELENKFYVVKLSSFKLCFNFMGVKENKPYLKDLTKFIIEVNELVDELDGFITTYVICKNDVKKRTYLPLRYKEESVYKDIKEIFIDNRNINDAFLDSKNNVCKIPYNDFIKITKLLKPYSLELKKYEDDDHVIVRSIGIDKDYDYIRFMGSHNGMAISDNITVKSNNKFKEFYSIPLDVLKIIHSLNVKECDIDIHLTNIDGKTYLYVDDYVYIFKDYKIDFSICDENVEYCSKEDSMLFMLEKESMKAFFKNVKNVTNIDLKVFKNENRKEVPSLNAIEEDDYNKVELGYDTKSFTAIYEGVIKCISYKNIDRSIWFYIDSFMYFKKILNSDNDSEYILMNVCKKAIKIYSKKDKITYYLYCNMSEIDLD